MKLWHYRPADHTKTQVYQAMLPKLNSGTVELLDLPKLRAQFACLGRRVTRGGRESIDHAPGAHDDLGNAAGALVTALERR